ncbi:hypothetical protein CXG81DRAFT_29778 [Caulochytrium protostelioides]|uniref:Uncharacterized protein n=1 Tax=Caulochytrium protostelioides TaxID=1555241 RepID=A0A4P9X7U1_9FUNG|nr:hypothetical protein CXG81DRAFT_29778 [Caulochytrium protostelioides]|eukprot:RKP01327.1 hypothetical protein CXG81DRAFT_29778 [Caulochytrium protostelioides]
MTSIRAAGATCPCHGAPAAAHKHRDARSRPYATAPVEKEYAFEMATSTIRYGRGVTAEVGMDMQNLNAKKVAVVTDPNIAKLLPFQTVKTSLEKHGVNHVVFDQVRVEPSDDSLRVCIEWMKAQQPDAIIAVGGGSAMDTAKAGALYLAHPDAEFLDFVNAPIGKGTVPWNPLVPLVAIPTTAGTGSETTGTSIFDLKARNVKTGIAFRALKPYLGIVDPLNTATMPTEVHVASGLDVLCHSMESFTAIPYHERVPRPTNPKNRPAYQGANPISDHWALKALEMCIKNLPKVYANRHDSEATEQMILAATFAGIGFGNAGVHLCHGMSYPISGLNKRYQHPGYNTDHPMIPHGISVAISAPAVFKYTADYCPERHLQMAQMFGKDVSRASKHDAGLILSDAIREFLMSVGVPNGIRALGYDKANITDLVKGTLPQRRVLDLAPGSTEHDDLARLFENSMKLY